MALSRRVHSPCAAVAVVVLFCATAVASDLDEFKVKREAVFEFAQKPAVTRRGDRVEIRFETRGFCDVTIAIEDERGRILRHLVSGVLGRNAPEPFRKDSKKQTIVWDGKDDQGRYVDEKDRVTVRVSLGLKPQFERTLFWTPYKRITEANPPIIKAHPEGVLVYEGQIYDSVRLYDHRGTYLRTVYPFPADKLQSFKDLHWATFPQDGARLPMKQWFRQATLLSSGDNSNHPWRGFGEQRFAHDGHGAGATHHAASTMAVRGNRVALAMLRLNRLGVDGSSGGLALNGPKLFFEREMRGYYADARRKIVSVNPTSAALTPDGKWLYLTGYQWTADRGSMRTMNYWLPCVLRIPFEGDGGPHMFVGSLKTAEEGNDNGHFSVPTSVACDAKGRVYVADYMNDRIQVYLPDGQFHKTIPVTRPAQIVVHERTGDIYVFSWAVGNWRLQKSDERVKAQLTHLGPLEEPGKRAQYDLSLIGYRGRTGPWTRGQDYSAEFDSWAEEPTIWLYRGKYSRTTWGGFYAGQARGRRYWQPAGIQMLTIKDGKLVVKRDFGKEAARAVLKSSRVAGTNRNLCVNPRTGRLYVGDGSAYEGFSWSLAVEIDPETGRSKLVELPFDTEQMAFDQDGFAYLRARGFFVRYDPTNWRQIPWDYGEQHVSIGAASSGASGPGFRRSAAASAVVVPQWEHAPQGVFSISPKGHIVVPIKGKQGSGVVLRRTEAGRIIRNVKPYQIRLYPGRSASGLVLVLDRQGRVVYDDAIPGLTFTHGIKIDKDDNLYAMALANRVLDGKPFFNPAACTLMKFRPKKGRIVGTHKRAVPVPMTDEQTPKRPPDLLGGGKPGLRKAWVEGAEWFYGGVGYNGEHHKNPDYGCDCCFSSFDLDYFARSFVPEVDHYSVAVLDTNGNLILRMGRYGNVDDGVPLVSAGGPTSPRSLGGDEIALFHAPHLATHTDRRLFIADVGNERIVSVKLDYHANERVALKDVPDRASR